eukprot:jgi/Mesen1/7173/ME000037S06531
MDRLSASVLADGMDLKRKLQNFPKAAASINRNQGSTGASDVDGTNAGASERLVEVGHGRPCLLQRTWSGSESTHTENIFQQPYADFSDHYEVGQVIGQGQFGCVRTCMFKKTRETFAVKVIIKSSLKTPMAVDVVREEVALMESVEDHPAVVALIDIIENSKYVCLVMELCHGGDLFDRIIERKSYPEVEAAQVCASIASVLEHCRGRGVMHRDLKPENILMCSRRSHTKICVADFGAGAFVSPGRKITGLAGSPYYVAPEVISGSYGVEADVWSAGVILYILLCGMPPFQGNDDSGVMAAIRASQVDTSWGPWRKISRGAKDLVRRMLTLDPALRITPDEILEHRWIVKCERRARAPAAPPLHLVAHQEADSCGRVPTTTSLPSIRLPAAPQTPPAFVPCRLKKVMTSGF